MAEEEIKLAMEYGKPVSLGISGPSMTRLQGQERVDEYAKRAVESAVKQVKRTREFKASQTGNKQHPIIIG